MDSGIHACAPRGTRAPTAISRFDAETLMKRRATGLFLRAATTTRGGFQVLAAARVTRSRLATCSAGGETAWGNWGAREGVACA